MKTRLGTSLVVVAGILALAGAARGDALKIGNQNYAKVKVVGLREGKLYFKTSGGADQSVLLDEVRSIELDKHPNLAKANAAFEKEDFATAAKLLAGVVDESKEDYVKVLAGSQLVVALDRSGKFQDAAKRYAKLLALDGGELVKSAKPTGLPVELAERVKLVQVLSVDAKAATDPVAKAFLNETIEKLKAEADAPAPAEDEPLVEKSGLLRSKDDSKNDAIDDALKAGKAEQALKAADEALAGKGGSPSRLLYQRGRALAMLEKEDDALLSYMRVVVHFGGRSSEHYSRSLLEAGRIFVKQGQKEHARQVLTEAQPMFEVDTDEAKEIKKMLAGLDG